MLYIFDADGTLCDRQSGELLPDVAEKIATLPSDSILTICTNQGGVGLRYWMEKDGFGEPKKYPTESQVKNQYRRIAKQIGAQRVYLSFAYQSKTSGKWGPVPNDSLITPRERDTIWSPEWRKPAPGMLLAALADHNCDKSDAVFIGDSDEDQEAAANAGIKFVHADEFFERR